MGVKPWGKTMGVKPWGKTMGVKPGVKPYGIFIQLNFFKVPQGGQGART